MGEGGLNYVKIGKNLKTFASGQKKMDMLKILRLTEKTMKKDIVQITAAG